MNREQLTQQWLAEEAASKIHGWDFSHIQGRFEEERDLPWDYGDIVRKALREDSRLLDLDTGGGEFLLSLNHPYQNTSATEAYPPNVTLCKELLRPLGIDFRQARGSGPLPFCDGAFDIVINRHGALNAGQIYRVLRPGGVFITQQVGAKNDRELVELLLPGAAPPFPLHDLDRVCGQFLRAGFEIVRREEAFRPVRFFDVGALVWFARVIEWEFPGFTVARCLPELFSAQRILKERGCLEGTIHRFLIVAHK